MKVNKNLSLLIIFLYILIHKFYLYQYREVFQYIINPLIWLLFVTVAYVGIYKHNEKYYQYEKIVRFRVLISALFYVFTFYSLGFIVGFTNNPYSKNLSGIIINIFSVVLIVILKELIRGVFVNEKRRRYFYSIMIILIISDLNLLFLIETLNINNLFALFNEYILPPILINLFCNYLCLKGGIYQGIIYRLILTIPAILIPVVPDYDYIIIMLFNTLIPLFTYLIIRNDINKKRKELIHLKIKPGNWIASFLISIFILMFALGVFSIKPTVILSNSMKPSISAGDLLIFEDCLIEEVKIKDVIQFKYNDYDIVHRVVEINKQKSTKLITKGDNNLKRDQGFVTEDNLVGCMKYHIPYLGYPAYFIYQLINAEEIQIGED